jgi:hypothetical protein
MLGKPTASLSSGLLARKGHARPAMRPQGFVTMTPAAQDDLGWNDMGDDFAQPHQHQPQMHIHPVPVEEPMEAPAPTVLRQRAELAEQIAPLVEQPEESFEESVEEEAPFEEAPVAEAPAAEAFVEEHLAPEPVFAPARVPVVSAGTLARVASEVSTSKSKAAFTLRLDHDRHLRLRLASAVTNHSAQQLVTQALDAFLESLTEVDALARQLGDRDERA